MVKKCSHINVRKFYLPGDSLWNCCCLLRLLQNIPEKKLCKTLQGRKLICDLFLLVIFKIRCSHQYVI